MRPSRRRTTLRKPRFEQMEPRLMLSGSPPGDDLMGLEVASQRYGFTGVGQTVAVIDSGIAYSHLALGGGYGAGYRVVGGFDFTGSRDGDPYDSGPNGVHGTHVAGIIAADGEQMQGVAPGVDLVSLRVIDDAGRGSISRVEEALRWVHENRNAFAHPITTVNLSMGTRFNGDSPPAGAVLEDELAQLEADGIFVAVAAGNRFTTYNQPGLAYPAASSHVVPVASVDSDGDLSYFTQRLDRVIAARGRSVLSSVPDSVGNHNGLDDDYGRYSGTSMAAPYVAAAGVLLRQAYEFVGRNDVDRSTLYDLMAATADVVRDDATGADYRRLNVQRALEAVMPQDDFGSSSASAHPLGTVVDTLSLEGTIGRLDDRDYFTFVASASGNISFAIDTTHALSPNWKPDASLGGMTERDDAISFHVEAGTTYTIGLGTAAGLGHYKIVATLEAELVATPLTTKPVAVTQREFLDRRISGQGEWLALTATRNGILTIQATFSHAAGNVDMQLRDAAGRLLAESRSTSDNERVDVSVEAGQTVYLRVWNAGRGVNRDVDLLATNLVSQRGAIIDVRGTNGADQFVATVGDVLRFSVNGVDYQFDADDVSTIIFRGLGGPDRATITGSAAAETASLRVGSASLRGDGYRVLAVGVEDVTIHGGGGADRATLKDSPGDDTFVATESDARLHGDGFSLRAVGFPTVFAYALSGGNDTAHLYDSPGDDTFLATPTSGRMTGEKFTRQARYFDAIYAYANSGGYDVARLVDSPGDDTFVGTPRYARFSGQGFLHLARFFDRVDAYAFAEGNDRAYLYDSSGDDTFHARADYSSLTTSGARIGVRRFEMVYAIASAGGRDRAVFEDSSQDDIFRAAGALAQLSNDATVARARGFERVSAYSTHGGADRLRREAVDYVFTWSGEWV